MKRRLPVLLESSIGQVRAKRGDLAQKFETQVRIKTRSTSCRKGCADCCYHPVTISILEGIILYRALLDSQQWTLKLRETLRETSERQYGISYAVWLLSLIPCPLLNEKKECRVHAARPLNCRTYYATSDPHHCHPHRLGDSTKILPRSEPVEAFAKAEEAILRRHHLQFLKIPIGSAVLLAERLCKEEITIDQVDRILFEEYLAKG